MHQPRHVVDPKSIHDLGAMGFHRLRTQLQANGDLLGGVTFGDELEDLELPWSEPLRGGSVTRTARSGHRADPWDDLIDEGEHVGEDLFPRRASPAAR